MSNSEISQIFQIASNVYSFLGENEFKIRGYENASDIIKNLKENLSEIPLEKIENIDGIGKGICSKIIEIFSTGTYLELENLLAVIPEGIQEMMNINGLSYKKLSNIYKQLGIDTIDKLIKGCDDKLLRTIKGIAEKTEIEIRSSIEFYLNNKGKFLYSQAETAGMEIIELLQISDFITNVSFTGELRRKNEIVNGIEILVASKFPEHVHKQLAGINYLQKDESQSALFVWRGTYSVYSPNPSTQLSKFLTIKHPPIPLEVIICSPESFFWKLFITTGSKNHVKKLLPTAPKNSNSEEEIYATINIAFIPPELREDHFEIQKINSAIPLIELSDIKGIIHVHSHFSDGRDSIETLARYCKDYGYEYLGISDHSKSAVYANGLTLDRLEIQWKEIDRLNVLLAPFKIFKGIEADILSDGKMDFEDDILKKFDFVIASIHSNLGMDEQKAMKRLIKAIENPYVNFLGHPTGRLLLIRPGYPVDHPKLISACIANNVCIEINSNPRRLDLDWRWYQDGVNKGLKFSINPDAHNTNGINDIRFGIAVARKGGLTKNNVINSYSLGEFEEIIRKIKIQLF